MIRTWNDMHCYASQTSPLDHRIKLLRRQPGLTERAHYDACPIGSNRNPFIAKRFGSPGNAWVRLIPLSHGRMFEPGPPHVAGPECG